MGHVIVVYAFLDDEGTDQEFLTFDMDLALARGKKYGLKVISRHYRLESSRIVNDYEEALYDSIEAEDESA